MGNKALCSTHQITSPSPLPCPPGWGLFVGLEGGELDHRRGDVVLVRGTRVIGQRGWGDAPRTLRFRPHS